MKKLLRPLHLTAIMFFTVSGGPYGLEPLIHNVGGTVAVSLILVTPVVWSLPVILMVLELNGMMPVEGGYYQWVKSALGPSWGFFEGWWTWLFMMTDLAIYPVLFTEYLAYFAPSIAPYKIPICIAMIWISTLLNLKAVILVGRSSVVLGMAVIVPFIVLFAAALLPRPIAYDAQFSGAPQALGLAALCTGLFNVMWNYQGWDNAFTIAEEVDTPVRSYVIAMIGALAIIVLTYFFSILTGAHSSLDPGVLEEEGFPALGNLLGGWWLGALLSAGGMASALGLFIASLLSISRVPKVMADDRFLPSPLGRLHPVSRVPYVAVLTCAVAVSFMVLWGFGDLLIIDVSLYSAALIPEFITLIAMRRSRPDAVRPFRIPTNVAGLIALTLLPLACIVAALAGLVGSGAVHLGAAWFALAAILTGPAAWMIVRRRA